MRIQHVITTLDVGGAEMHLLAQVRGQAERGHEPRVAWLKGAGSLREDFRAAGASAVEKVGFHPGTPLALFGRMRAADVTHSHLLKADMLCAAVAPLARAILVSSKHNDERVLERAPVGFVHGMLGRVPKRTIVLSDHVGGFVQQHGRVPRTRMTRIYYGLDPAPFVAAAAQPQRRAALRAELGVAEGEVLFVCVARFAPQKAHDVLLRGFAAARATGAPVRLLLVGDDPFGDGRGRAERLAGELGLGDTVHFAGIRRDVPELLAASDAFVMTSLWEGLGLVFLEAMAAGLPVLATSVSAVSEVVVHERTGLLVPPSDPEALARAMGALAADAELRRRLGTAGTERVVRDFRLDAMVDQTLAVYAQAVKR
ncbi:MAG TPA: glycosyltransferase family 4 protein [Planctomycetota bacterium]|nr:glycosyltransferase family 4 protein [Planctomycetota bacterium]